VVRDLAAEGRGVLEVGARESLFRSRRRGGRVREVAGREGLRGRDDLEVLVAVGAAGCSS
jgi:hypothetical protein